MFVCFVFDGVPIFGIVPMQNRKQEKQREKEEEHRKLCIFYDMRVSAVNNFRPAESAFSTVCLVFMWPIQFNERKFV